MQMLALLAPFASWLLRAVVVKFVVLSGIVGAVVFLVPLAVGWLAPFLGVDSLNSAFAGLAPGAWYFLDLMRLDVGLPLVISAAVARFVIRRLPVIG